MYILGSKHAKCSRHFCATSKLSTQHLLKQRHKSLPYFYMKKILLLGSGELGKEFTIAAQRLGQHIIACDNYPGAPAMQVADEFEVFSMLDGDALDAVVAKHKPDVIISEIEAIRTERLYDYEKQGVRVASELSPLHVLSTSQ